MAATSAAPLVSVIVSCYNQGLFLCDALGSIRLQSHASIESIVVDDGSTDDTAASAASMPWSRYVYQRNAGTAAARNTGLAHSQGEFVVFLDADDRLTPDAIATGLCALASHPEWGFVTGHVQLIDANGSSLGVPPQRHADPATYFDLLRSNHIWTPGAVMYRRRILGSAPFRAAAGGSADIDLNLRLARGTGFGCHHRVVLEYRRHGANMTGNPRFMLSSAIRVRTAQRQHVRDSPEGRRALADGIANVRANYGEQVVQQVKASARSPRRWREALGGLLCLIRYHPAGIARLLTAALAKLRPVGSR